MSMYRTDFVCKKCKNKLYRTALEGKLWCKNCREYKKEEKQKKVIKNFKR